MSYGSSSSDLLGGPQDIYWGPLVCLSHSLNLNFSWSFSFNQAHNWNISWFALLATAGAFGLLSDGGKQPMGRSSCKLDILCSIMGSSRSFILLAWMFSFWWNCLCLPTIVLEDWRIDETGNTDHHFVWGIQWQGMAAGHAYYFLEDVYPLMTGRRILRTPGIIKALFPTETVVVSRPPPTSWGAAAPPAAVPHRDWELHIFFIQEHLSGLQIIGGDLDEFHCFSKPFLEYCVCFVKWLYRNLSVFSCLLP